jgi:hypothetical protein
MPRKLRTSSIRSDPAKTPTAADAILTHFPGLSQEAVTAFAGMTEPTLDGHASSVSEDDVTAWTRSLTDAGVFTAIHRDARRQAWKRLLANPPRNVDLAAFGSRRRLVQITRRLSGSAAFRSHIARQLAVMTLSMARLKELSSSADMAVLGRHIPTEWQRLEATLGSWDGDTAAKLVIQIGLPAFVDQLVQGIVAVTARAEVWTAIDISPDLELDVPALSLPAVADVFAGGDAQVPTFHAVWGLLDAIHNAQRMGAWTDHDGVTSPTHSTTTGRGSGAVHVTARDTAGTLRPSIDILPALWEKVRAMDDLTSDTLLVCLAHWVARGESVNSAVWITADAVLDARGVRRKHYEAEGKRWAHGHRTEDRLAVGRALAQLDSLWLQLVNVGVSRSSSKRKPRSINIESKAMAMLDRAVQPAFDGENVFLAARVMPGSWATAYRDARVWQTGLLAQRALAYDPYREQPEKRLAKFLAFQVRIDAHNGRTSLDRKVATLLENAGLTPDPSHPDRSKQRLEKALDRLCQDKVVDGWCYANPRSLPSKRWLDEWQARVIQITPRALERETYTRFQKQARWAALPAAE